MKITLNLEKDNFINSFVRKSTLGYYQLIFQSKEDFICIALSKEQAERLTEDIINPKIF